MRLFDRTFDPSIGGVEEIHADSDGTLNIRTTINNNPLIEQNLQERNMGHNGFSQTRNFRKIADIDMVTVMKLKTDYNIDMQRWNYQDKIGFKKWLAMPDNAYFRTYTGSI